MAGRGEAEEQELPQGGLLGEWVPVWVKRAVSPGVPAGPVVVGVPVADVGTVAGRAVARVQPGIGAGSATVLSGAGPDKARMLPLGSTSPATTAATTKISEEHTNAVV